MAKEIVLVLCISAAVLLLSWFAVNYIDEYKWKKYLRKENKK